MRLEIVGDLDDDLVGCEPCDAWVDRRVWNRRIDPLRVGGYVPKPSGDDPGDPPHQGSGGFR